MCMPSRHTGFGEVYFRSLLTQVLVEGEWAGLCLGSFSLGKVATVFIQQEAKWVPDTVWVFSTAETSLSLWRIKPPHLPAHIVLY
jgi:hypothetical protein